MDKLIVRIKQKLPPDNPPHPSNSPILVHYAYDLGWIIEKVYEGEYEVQNLPFEGKNESIDWCLLEEVSNGRKIFISI